MRAAAGAATTAVLSAAALALPAMTAVSASAQPAPQAAPVVLEGEMVARISVTIDPDEDGTILVPSPFTVVPGARRVVIHVPESQGIFVLAGERILHHYPLDRQTTELHDLGASGELLAAARRLEGRSTAEVRLFDLVTGRALERLRTANPHLRVSFEATDLWRLVVDADRVGIYQPEAGATYPLWSRSEGHLAGSEQVGLATSGIGYPDWPARLIPALDGSVHVRRRARETERVPAGEGEFLDGEADGMIAMMLPAETARSDADGDFLLPPELAVRLIAPEGARRDVRLVALDKDVRARRLVIQGRPVRIYRDRIFWIFLGRDFLEVRSADMSPLFPDRS